MYKILQLKWLKFLLIYCLISATLVFHNMPTNREKIIPYEDIAADILLMDRAEKGWLLVGHYSRFGFNHPGPFFLYERYLIKKWVTAIFSFPPYSSDLLAVLLVNAFFLTLATIALANNLDGGKWPGIISATTALAFALIQFSDSFSPALRWMPVVANLWMPALLVAPFLALVFLLTETLSGRLQALPFASLTSGALVHGYAPMPLFVVPSWSLALVLGWIRYQRNPSLNDPDLPIKSILLWSIFVILLFVAPILIDSLFNSPGNLQLILSRTRLLTEEKNRSWLEAVFFVLHYWGAIKWPLWIAAGVGLFCHWHDQKRRGNALINAVVLIVSMITVLFTVYVKTAPGELMTYIGLFYQSAPLAVVMAYIANGAFSLFRMACQKNMIKMMSAIVGVFYLLVASTGSFRDGYQGEDQIRVLSDQIRVIKSTSTVRIGFDEHNNWTIATGLLVHLAENNVSACVLKPELSFLFTPEKMCPDSDNHDIYLIVSSKNCNELCMIKTKDYGLRFMQ